MSQGNAAAKPTRIRKIFRKDDAFVCGMCGTSHAQQTDAEACLARCTQTMLANGEDATEQAPKRYRCSFCKRVYPDLELAKDCSRGCRKNLESKMAKENHVLQGMTREQKLQALIRFAQEANASEALKSIEATTGISATGTKAFRPKPKGMLPGENVKFQREKHLFRCLRCKQRYKDSREAVRCFDQHGENFKAPVVSKPREDSHKFFRDNAKYRCNKCHSGYFSGDEAAACFDGHPADFVRKVKAPKAEEAAPEAKLKSAKGETKEVSPEDSPIASENAAEASSAPAESPIEAAAAALPKKRKEEGDDLIYYRDGAKYVCRGCDKKYFTREDVVACFQGHTPSEGVEKTEQPASLQLEDAEMFLRDGAKYVCKSCRAKYFTRIEVITCFQSHS